MDYSKTDPASVLKDTTSSCYWASTTHSNYSYYAWTVRFDYGYSYYGGYKNDSKYVRCVRDGKNGLEWAESSKEKMNWDEAVEYAKSLETSVYYKA